MSGSVREEGGGDGETEAQMSFGARAGGGGGRGRFGDYGLGDISRLIDELMRSEPGARGPPPTAAATIAALEELTYGATDATGKQCVRSGCVRVYGPIRASWAHKNALGSLFHNCGCFCRVLKKRTRRERRVPRVPRRVRG